MKANTNQESNDNTENGKYAKQIHRIRHFCLDFLNHPISTTFKHWSLILLNSHIFYLVKWSLSNFWVNIFSFDMSIFDNFSFSYFASTYNLKTRLVAFQQNIIHYYTNISICCQIFKWTWFAAGFSTTYTIRSNLLWTSSITRTSLINFFYYMRIRLVLTWVLHKHYWWLLTLWRYIHTRTFLHLS